MLLLRGVYAGNCEGGERIELVSADSIPDFAIAARPFDTNEKSEWVPVHGQVDGVSRNVELRITIDGEELALDELAEPLSATAFKMVQKFDGWRPDGTSPMWRHEVIHSISIDSPALLIENEVEPITPVRVSAAYFGMLPVSAAVFDRLMLGTEEVPLDQPHDGTNVPFHTSANTALFTGTDGDRCFSAAIDVQGEFAAQGRIDFRAGGEITKLYWPSASKEWTAGNETSGRQLIFAGETECPRS